MADMSSEQSTVFIICILFVTALILYTRFGKHKGSDLSEIVFGIRTKKKPEQEKPVGPKERNGNQTDLTLFASRLLKTASKCGMRVVMPAMIDYKGQTIRLTAFLVAPSGVTGIYCLGYGGTVRSAGEKEEWKQRINGEDKTIPNPLPTRKQLCEQAKAAMEDAGIQAELDVVVVFTNPGVTLEMAPSAFVYTSKRFMEHMKQTDALKRGDLDVEKTTQALAVLADIKGKRAAARGRKKG